MKKILLLLVFSFLLETLIGQNVSIPDNNFKNALLNSSAINTTPDSEITLAEANAYTGEVLVSGLSISDLTGIESFVNITGLDCSINNLTALDVTSNTALINLYCGYNNLTSLDVTQNIMLTTLACFQNGLTALDVSKNTSLSLLSCNNNSLSSLNLSENTALTNLNCSFNTLSALDISTNTGLIILFCNNNQLNTLDLSSNTGLLGLYCGDNNFKVLDISNQTSLSTFFCNDNEFTFSDLAKIKADFDGLTYVSAKHIFEAKTLAAPFEVDYSTEVLFSGENTVFDWYRNNVLTITDVETLSPGKFKFLKEGVYFCKMSNAYFSGTELNTHNITVGASAGISIPDLNFKNALLNNGAINTTPDSEITISEASAYTGEILVSGLNISDLTGIEYFVNISGLDCSINKLTALDVKYNTALTNLYCGNNSLTSLDVTQNIMLTTLACFQNGLTALDVSKNTSLSILSCNNNSLNSLNLSENTALTNLNCSFNSLSALDISTNTGLSVLFCNNNHLNTLDLSANTGLLGVSCGDNNLKILDISKQTSLSTLFCNENIFPLSALGNIKSYLSTFNYTSAKIIFEEVSSLVDHIVDYSNEAVILGKSTSFSWYKNGLPVDVQQESVGVFNLNSSGDYYCIMGNEEFSGVDFKTNNINIKKTLQTISVLNLPTTAMVDESLTIEASSDSGLALSMAVSSGNASISDNVVHFTEAGLVEITISQAGNAVYDAAEKVVSVTVNKKSQTISVSNFPTTAMVDESLTIEASSDSGLALSMAVSSGNASISDNVVHFTESGLVEITISQAGNAVYDAAEKVVSVTVNKKSQTISVSNLPTTAMVDESITIEASSNSGLALSMVVSSGNASISDNVVHFTESGLVEITISQAGNAVYDAAEKVVSVTVNKKSQTISVSNLPTTAMVDESITIEASSDSGLALSMAVSSGNASISDNVVHFTESGLVEITISQAGSAIYNSAEKVVSVTVTKKSQTISVSNLPTTAMADESLTIEASSDSGLALSMAVSSGNASISDNVVHFTESGLVEITISQAGSAIYNSAEKVVSVTVNKKSQTISVSNLPTTAMVDESITIEASSDSGLALSMAVSSGNASISDNVVHFTEAGLVEITISQVGNAIYNSAEKLISVTVNVVAGIEDVIEKKIQFYPNPVVDVLNINLGNDATSLISIYNLHGVLVYQKRGESSIDRLQLSHLKKGVYIIDIKGKEGSFKSKIIKK